MSSLYLLAFLATGAQANFPGYNTLLGNHVDPSVIFLVAISGGVLAASALSLVLCWCLRKLKSTRTQPPKALAKIANALECEEEDKREIRQQIAGLLASKLEEDVPVTYAESVEVVIEEPIVSDDGAVEVTECDIEAPEVTDTDPIGKVHVGTLEKGLTVARLDQGRAMCDQ
eukprot:gb/GEZN01018649.1/.p1 GENE.gb/GEZN01018649.1/~~gb/GEZN01018649.1/.p1  ORF type:complete len:193 (+),score=28.10 gb/GEZN01018649.1/:66-581(+)